MELTDAFNPTVDGFRILLCILQALHLNLLLGTQTRICPKVALCTLKLAARCSHSWPPTSVPTCTSTYSHIVLLGVFCQPEREHRRVRLLC